ncbi:glucodextranase DOMON-like domain-containing protein [Saliphagus sp. GCM10025308]
MLGYDPDAPGNVMQAEAEATETTFGGAQNDSAPNAIDVVTPADVDWYRGLAYSDGTRATVQYIPLVTTLEPVATFDEPTGEPYGPGTYEYPTSDDFYEGAWDIDELTVSASRDHVEFAFTMASEIQNPWGLPRGFSHQFFQVYVHDPDADVEGTTEGRTGLNANMATPYHYRVVVNGESVKSVESAAGDSVSSNVETNVEGGTVSVRVPADAIGWDVDVDGGIGIAALVAPFDGYGDGAIRGIAPEAGEYVIGGGTGENDPAVMDMVTPEGVDRVEVLSESDGSVPQLPFVVLGDVDLPEAGDGSSSDGSDGSDGSGGSEGADGDDGSDGDGADNNGSDADGNGNDENESTDESNGGSSDDSGSGGNGGSEDDGLPGFGAVVGTAGVAGGTALAAKRLAREDDE